MYLNPSNPIIVQSDMTILLETMSSKFDDARDFLCQFAELRKSPEYIHTYSISPLSLWNAASTGLTSKAIIDGLLSYSKYQIPDNVLIEIKNCISRFGIIKLYKDNGSEVLRISEPSVFKEVCCFSSLKSLIRSIEPPDSVILLPESRGIIKQSLLRLGYPVEDLCGYDDGDKLLFSLRTICNGTKMPFHLRTYQEECSRIFNGDCVMVLPCGAGKTIIAIACMQRLQQKTLILTTNVTALRQWRNELLDKTTLTDNDIGEYSGDVKEIKPVTISTYQLLTYKKNKGGEFVHMSLFSSENWGLIIYDEVHMLPAPVFRATTGIQSKRRLGLTATLVREDGKEEDVFSLIGPKRYDKPWKDLEDKGFIAKAQCIEIRVPMDEDVQLRYVSTGSLKDKYRIAMENPYKLQIMLQLLKRHEGERILIIGQYIDQLNCVQKMTGASLITGATPNHVRDQLYAAFRAGSINILVVSKVANFAIDLPDASIAIQLSGTYGSRQEESQRLGRILRPKSGINQAYFYSIVTRDSKDQDCSRKRALFLTEQGYQYQIVLLDKQDLLNPTKCLSNHDFD